MAREWCVVVELGSASAARKLGRVLGKEGFDAAVDGDPARVWCFAANENECRVFEGHVVALAEENGLIEKLSATSIREWSEDERRYVDPEAERNPST
jgi:hypothetical protein